MISWLARMAPVDAFRNFQGTYHESACDIACVVVDGLFPLEVKWLDYEASDDRFDEAYGESVQITWSDTLIITDSRLAPNFGWSLGIRAEAVWSRSRLYWLQFLATRKGQTLVEEANLRFWRRFRPKITRSGASGLRKSRRRLRRPQR